MEIYEKIENMFVDDTTLLEEILKELREIKAILKNSNKEVVDDGFKEFINRFTQDIQEDEINGIYPEIEIDGSLLGYKDGVFYDKYTNEKFDESESKKILSEVYRNYNISKKIEDFL